MAEVLQVAPYAHALSCGHHAMPPLRFKARCWLHDVIHANDAEAQKCTRLLMRLREFADRSPDGRTYFSVWDDHARRGGAPWLT